MFRNICIATLLVAMVACGSDDKKEEAVPLESKTAALTTTENVVNHIEGLDAVLQFLETSALIEETFNMFGSEGEIICEPVPYEPGEEPGEPYCYEPEPEEFEVTLDDLTDDVTEWFNEHVFVDSQIESEDGTTVVYLLDPVIFCDEASEASGGAGNQPPIPGEPDDKSDDIYDEEMEDEGGDCEDFLAKVPLRIRIVSYSEGDVDIDILFGVDQLAPLHLQVYADLLAAEVDLAAAKAVALLIIDALGDEEEEVELPDVFEGKLRAELKQDSAKKYSMTWSVKETVKVGMTIEGDEFSAELGKSSMTATADADAQTIAWSVDFNEAKVKFPYQLFIDAWYDSGEEEDGEYPDEKAPPIPADDIYDEQPEAPQVTGDMELFLAGFSGAATFQADTDVVSITNLGLGDGASYLKKGATTLVSAAFNQDNGWAADMTITYDGNDVTVKVSPLLDLAITWFLKGIESDLDEVPGFLLDETFQVLFDSDPEPTVVFKDGSEDSDGGIKVTAGKLILSSSAAPEETVTVEAGMCLVGQDDEGGEDVEGEEDPIPEAEEGHELLSSFVAEQCG